MTFAEEVEGEDDQGLGDWTWTESALRTGDDIYTPCVWRREWHVALAGFPIEGLYGAIRVILSLPINDVNVLVVICLIYNLLFIYILLV